MFLSVSQGIGKSSNLTGLRYMDTTHRSKTVHTALNERDERGKRKNKEIKEVRKRGKKGDGDRS